MIRTVEDVDAVQFLGRYIHGGLIAATEAHPDPVALTRVQCDALVSYAGSLLLTMLRNRVLNDGEHQQELDALVAELRKSADPSISPGPGSYMAGNAAASLREALKRGA